MGFSRQKWVAISFLRASSQPGIKPGSLALRADSLLLESPGKPYSYFSDNIFCLVPFSGLCSLSLCPSCSIFMLLPTINFLSFLFRGRYLPAADTLKKEMHLPFGF